MTSDANIAKSEWVNIKDKKPDSDGPCFVMNCRGGEGGFIAIYQKGYDVFKLYDPNIYNHPCIDVTHWVPLPYTRADL